NDIFARREEAMHALGVSSSDPRWGEGWVRQSRTILYQGDIPAAEALVEKALAAAEAHHWPHIEALAASQEGSVRLSQGDTARAVEAYTRALRAFEKVNDPLEHADTLSGFGGVLVFRHNLDDAERVLNKAIALHR